MDKQCSQCREEWREDAVATFECTDGSHDHHHLCVVCLAALTPGHIPERVEMSGKLAVMLAYGWMDSRENQQVSLN